jgi:hypothetical protein
MMSPQRICACAVAWFAAASPSHLRVTNDRILEVMQYAAVRSPTFRTLVAAVGMSNRIVYVDEGSCRGETVRSCVQPVAEGLYIRVLVDPRGPINGVARQLPHEFQHVLEISGMPAASGVSAIRQMYERVGFQSCAADGDCYETRKALEVESLVSREVSSGHAVSLNAAYFGTWNLHIDKSSYDKCPPMSGRRFDHGQRHGLASAVVEFVDCVGIEHRDAFVYRADGRDYSMPRGNGRPSPTIAVTVIDNLTSTFVIKNDGIVVACGQRIISPDGKVMTIETWTTVDGEERRRTFESWDKVD